VCVVSRLQKQMYCILLTLIHTRAYRENRRRIPDMTHSMETGTVTTWHSHGISHGSLDGHHSAGIAEATGLGIIANAGSYTLCFTRLYHDLYLSTHHAVLSVTC